MPPLYSQRYAYIFIMQSKQRTMQGKRNWQILILSCMIYQIDIKGSISMKNELLYAILTKQVGDMASSPLPWSDTSFLFGGGQHQSVTWITLLTTLVVWRLNLIFLWFDNYLEENKRVKADDRKYRIETHEHCLKVLVVGFDTLTKQVGDRASSGLPW